MEHAGCRAPSCKEQFLSAKLTKAIKTPSSLQFALKALMRIENLFFFEPYKDSVEAGS